MFCEFLNMFHFKFKLEFVNNILMFHFKFKMAFMNFLLMFHFKFECSILNSKFTWVFLKITNAKLSPLSLESCPDSRTACRCSRRCALQRSECSDLCCRSSDTPIQACRHLLLSLSHRQNRTSDSSRSLC